MNHHIDTARATFEGALAALRAGDSATAERLARAALDEHPADANFLAVLGAALNRQNRAAEAEAVLRTAIDVDPGYAKAHEALAHSLLAQRQPEDAIAALRQALLLNPALESAQITLSQALLAAGQDDEAKAAFDGLLQRRPQGQRLADDLLEELWRTVQSIDRYRGRTTLIITTDHGRGRTPADWIDHDTGIQGSQDIWLAILGPDTPAIGEARDFPDVTQSDVAATMLQYLGLDYRDFNASAGPPVPGSLTPR